MNVIAFLQESRIIRLVANFLAILLSIGVAVYALLLLFTGEARTVVPEGASGTPPSPATVQFVPNQAALIPLLAALCILAGILMGKLQVAWFGVATLVIFGTLSVFGIGGPVFFPAWVLLGLVTLIQIIQRERSKSP